MIDLIRNQDRRLRYGVRALAEVAIIFTGITISFLFDEWKQDRELTSRKTAMVKAIMTDLTTKKDELLSDTPACTLWINRLDSMQQERIRNELSEAHLLWLNKIINSGDIFFFSPETEAYSSAQSTEVFQHLPDSLRRGMHKVFKESFAYNEMAYTQTRMVITNFRNNFVVPNGTMFTHHSGQLSKEDFTAMRDELKRPQYANFFRAIIMLEEKLKDHNLASIAAISKLQASLQAYLEQAG